MVLDRIDKAASRRLRENQTDAENRLWYALRNRGLGGYKFRRQHQIGPYFVDFCCADRKLIVELDGGQHAEKNEYDQIRSEFLAGAGYQVLRFWNNEVLGDREAVLEVILRALREPE